MLKAILGTAIFVTSLGMAWVFAGDSYLLNSSNYGLLAFLWASHFVFWLGYLAVSTPVLLLVARRGDPRQSDAPLAALLLGAGGAGYVLWASTYYLHQDMGFFAPGRLFVNGMILLGIFLLAAIVFAGLRRGAVRLGKAFRAVPVLGLLGLGSFWGYTLATTLGATVELDLSDLETGHGGPPEESAASGGPGDAPTRRVILVGLDGADWRLIDPLVEEGELPHFARLRQEGATAPMQTVSPFSPVDWTTIATGVGPGRHSVQGFSEMYAPSLNMTIHRLNNNFLEPIFSRFFEKIPVSSSTRSQKTLWEIVDAFSMPSLTINWWATFPVAPHEGVLISNYAIPWDELSAERIAEVRDLPHMVHPGEIWPEVVEVMESVVVGGISVHSWRGNSLDDKLTRVDFWNLRDRIVDGLYERFRSPEHVLSMIYYQGIDTTCHHYSEAVFGANRDLPREPRVGPEVISEKREMIRDAYRRMDGRLGALMAGMEPGDLLVVVSDHGWNFDGTSHWRTPDAMFALYGGGVRKGFRLGRRHLFDVAPTVLYYLGLPISRELQGEILAEAFTDGVQEELPLSYVASYGPRNSTLRVSDNLIDAAHKKMLTPLGYR